VTLIYIQQLQSFFPNFPAKAGIQAAFQEPARP